LVFSWWRKLSEIYWNWSQRSEGELNFWDNKERHSPNINVLSHRITHVMWYFSMTLTNRPWTEFVPKNYISLIFVWIYIRCRSQHHSRFRSLFLGYILFSLLSPCDSIYANFYLI
jgi:VanZ family protein